MVWSTKRLFPEEVRFQRQEALRQGPGRQVHGSQLKGYREGKGLDVGKGEVVLGRGILRKIKILRLASPRQGRTIIH